MAEDRRVPLRGLYRGIYGALLDDPGFQELSPAARHVLLTVRLCPQNTIASIFRWYPALLQVQTGYGRPTLLRALQELAQTTPPWIELDATVLWIRNGLRYDPSIRLADAKHRIAVERAVAGLPHSEIVGKFCEYYRIARALEGPAKGLGSPLGDLSPPNPTPSPTPTPTPSPTPKPPRSIPEGGESLVGAHPLRPDGSLKRRGSESESVGDDPCVVVDVTVGEDAACHCAVTGKPWSQRAGAARRCRAGGVAGHGAPVASPASAAPVSARGP